MKNYQEKYFDSINNVIYESEFKINNEIVSSDKLFKDLIQFTRVIKKKKGRIFFFGNGASAAFSNHMALDWSKNGGIQSFSLSDSAMLTAFSNDYNYREAFLEFLKLYKPTNKDIVVTISSSGNSDNVVQVLNYCKEMKIITLALSGLKPNNLSCENSYYSIYVPRKTYGIVECSHQIYLHLWLDFFMGVSEWEKNYYQDMNYKNYKI